MTDDPQVIVAPAHVVPPSAEVAKVAANVKAEAATIAASAKVDSTVLTEAGQRRINFIWEATQSMIAAVIVLSNVGIGILFAFRGTPADQFPFVLSSSMFLVIGFYFSRTNHAAIGGAGPKPTLSPYEGR